MRDVVCSACNSTVVCKMGGDGRLPVLTCGDCSAKVEEARVKKVRDDAEASLQVKDK